MARFHDASLPLAPTAVRMRTSEPPRRFEPFHRLVALNWGAHRPRLLFVTSTLKYRSAMSRKPPPRYLDLQSEREPRRPRRVQGSRESLTLADALLQEAYGHFCTYDFRS